MAYQYGLLNPKDYAKPAKFWRIPCNCGGQITFRSESALNAVPGTNTGTWWIMFDKPAIPLAQYIARVDPGVPMTFDSSQYLQEGDLYAICDLPNDALVGPMHYFCTWQEQ